MIIGIGTDICDIRRIKKQLAKPGDAFETKIFTTGEREYCRAHIRPEERFAKRFAAKEALAKALSSEDSEWLSWQDVEVFNDASGRPNLRLHRAAKERLFDFTPDDHTAVLHLTLSDEPPFAVAFVIVEALPDPEG